MRTAPDQYHVDDFPDPAWPFVLGAILSRPFVEGWEEAYGRDPTKALAFELGYYYDSAALDRLLTVLKESPIVEMTEKDLSDVASEWYSSTMFSPYDYHQRYKDLLSFAQQWLEERSTP